MTNQVYCLEDGETYDKDVIVKWFEGECQKQRPSFHGRAISVKSPKTDDILQKLTLFGEDDEVFYFDATESMYTPLTEDLLFFKDKQLRGAICSYISEQNPFVLKKIRNLNKQRGLVPDDDKRLTLWDIYGLDLPETTVCIHSKGRVCRGSDFTSSHFVNCTFENDHFISCIFREVTFTNCSFKGKSMSFFGCDMKGAKFVACRTDDHLSNSEDFYDDLCLRGALNVLKALHEVDGETPEKMKQVAQKRMKMIERCRLGTYKKFWDMTLVAQGIEFRVHRIFLLQYPGYFEFLIECPENKGKSRFELLGVSALALASVLARIYNGVAPEVPEYESAVNHLYPGLKLSDVTGMEKILELHTVPGDSGDLTLRFGENRDQELKTWRYLVNKLIHPSLCNSQEVLELPYSNSTQVKFLFAFLIGKKIPDFPAEVDDFITIIQRSEEILTEKAYNSVARTLFQIMFYEQDFSNEDFSVEALVTCLRLVRKIRFRKDGGIPLFDGDLYLAVWNKIITMGLLWRLRLTEQEQKELGYINFSEATHAAIKGVVAFTKRHPYIKEIRVTNSEIRSSQLFPLAQLEGKKLVIKGCQTVDFIHTMLFSNKKKYREKSLKNLPNQLDELTLYLLSKRDPQNKGVCEKLKRHTQGKLTDRGVKMLVDGWGKDIERIDLRGNDQVTVEAVKTIIDGAPNVKELFLHIPRTDFTLLRELPKLKHLTVLQLGGDPAPSPYIIAEIVKETPQLEELIIDSLPEGVSEDALFPLIKVKVAVKYGRDLPISGFTRNLFEKGSAVSMMPLNRLQLAWLIYWKDLDEVVSYVCRSGFSSLGASEDFVDFVNSNNHKVDLGDLCSFRWISDRLMNLLRVYLHNQKEIVSIKFRRSDITHSQLLELFLCNPAAKIEVLDCQNVDEELLIALLKETVINTAVLDDLAVWLIVNRGGTANTYQMFEAFKEPQTHLTPAALDFIAEHKDLRDSVRVLNLTGNNSFSEEDRPTLINKFPNLERLEL